MFYSQQVFSFLNLCKANSANEKAILWSIISSSVNFLHLKLNKITKPKLAKNTELINSYDFGKKEAEYLAFIEFLATPKCDRKLKTQNDSSCAYNVHITTLSDWKKRKGFYEEVKKVRNDWGKSKTSDILGHLYETIMNSDRPCGNNVLIWLRYFDGFNPNANVREPEKIERKLSPEQRKVLTVSLINFGVANLEQAQAFALNM